MVKLPTPDSARYDKRMIERLKVQGKIKEKEVKDFLNALPDETQSLERIPIWNENDSLPSEKIARGNNGKEHSGTHSASNEPRQSHLAKQVGDEISEMVYDDSAAAGEMEE